MAFDRAEDRLAGFSSISLISLGCAFLFVPLYRLYGKADHFYTTSDAERDNAVAMYGYLFEAQVGFVWPAP